MSQQLILYGVDISPSVRTCLLTLKALDIPYEMRNTEEFVSVTMKEVFMRKNPLGKIPVLDDDGQFIADSHAICAYLVDKYGPDDNTLYPKDLVSRAIVNERMHFEASTLFGAFNNILRPMKKDNVMVVPKAKTEIIVEGYEALEKLLNQSDYVAGNIMTLADFCYVTTITSVRAFLEINPKKYSKIHNWLERMQALPYYEEANGKGCTKLLEYVKLRATSSIFRTSPSILYFRRA